MRGISSVFAVGTLGLAAATGTLGPLILASGFAYTTYAITNATGRNRIKAEVADELQNMQRQSAFLERFMKDDDYQHKKGAWANERDLKKLRKLFSKRRPKTGDIIEITPTWSALMRRKQAYEYRLEELKRMVESRIPKNKLAASMAGVATFLFPPVGVAAIGYQVIAKRYQSAAQKLRAKESDEAEIAAELEDIERRAAESVAKATQSHADDEELVTAYSDPDAMP